MGWWVGGSTISRVEGHNKGRFEQTMGMGRNEGKERVHEEDNMDTEANIQIWKEVGLWGGGRGLTGVEKIMVLDWIGDL